MSVTSSDGNLRKRGGEFQMANPNQENQQSTSQSYHDSLMADLYFGTPIGLDNNSGEFNLNQQVTPEEGENQVE
jgi:hypothetical protein